MAETNIHTSSAAASSTSMAKDDYCWTTDELKLLQDMVLQSSFSVVAGANAALVCLELDAYGNRDSLMSYYLVCKEYSSAVNSIQSPENAEFSLFSFEFLIGFFCSCISLIFAGMRDFTDLSLEDALVMSHDCCLKMDRITQSLGPVRCGLKTMLLLSRMKLLMIVGQDEARAIQSTLEVGHMSNIYTLIKSSTSEKMWLHVDNKVLENPNCISVAVFRLAVSNLREFKQYESAVAACEAFMRNQQSLACSWCESDVLWC